MPAKLRELFSAAKRSCSSSHLPQMNQNRCCELQLAVDGRLHIVQFRIESVSLNDDLKFYLSTLHWLDGSNPPVSSELERLTAAVGKLLKIEHSAPLAATSAILSHAQTNGDDNLTEATLFSATITLNSPNGEKHEFFRRLEPIIAHSIWPF